MSDDCGLAFTERRKKFPPSEAIKLREEDLSYIAAAIAQGMKSVHSIPSDKHHLDHTFLEEIRPILQSMVDERKAREAYYCALCEKVKDTGILGFLGILCYSLWEYIQRHIHSPS
jgi:hypothetical protein